MKYIAKPPTVVTVKTEVKVEDLPLSDISIDRLLDTGLMILYREMKNLAVLSSSGKLEASDSRDLRDITKLLFDMKEREAQSLRNLTDEELQAKAKQALEPK